MAQVLLFLVFILSLIFSFNVHASEEGTASVRMTSKILDILNEAKVSKSTPLPDQPTDIPVYNLSVTCMVHTAQAGICAYSAMVLKAKCGYVQLQDTGNAAVFPHYLGERQSISLVGMFWGSGVPIKEEKVPKEFPESAWVNGSMTVEMLVEAAPLSRPSKVTYYFKK